MYTEQAKVSRVTCRRSLL